MPIGQIGAIGRLGLAQTKGVPWASIGQALRVGGAVLRVGGLPLVVRR